MFWRFRSPFDLRTGTRRPDIVTPQSQTITFICLDRKTANALQRSERQRMKTMYVQSTMLREPLVARHILDTKLTHSVLSIIIL